MNTIIFCSDGSCPEPIFSLAVARLKRFDVPVISVTHDPLDLGQNICVGRQKRSWLTLYRQLLKGLDAAQTDNVCICEHDCLYTEEHINWQPPDARTFFYNTNVWLVQWAKKNHPELNGMYSHWGNKRLALSQLICNRDLYKKVIDRRLDIIDRDRSLVKAVEHIGEPGVSYVKKARKWASSGRSVYLKEYLGRALELERYETFKTDKPNLDIRHDANFTGPRRGIRRRYELPHWGRFEDIINGL